MASAVSPSDSQSRPVLRTSASGVHVTANPDFGSGDADVMVSASGDPERLSTVLLAITDKLEQLQKSARDKRAILEANSKSATQSRGGGAAAVLRNSDSAAAREEMSRTVPVLLETKSNFDALGRALTLSQSAEVLDQALGGDANATVALNKEEVNHLKGLLSEQKELILDVLSLEDRRVTAQLNLLSSMEDRAAAFAFEGDDTDKLFQNKSGENGGGAEGDGRSKEKGSNLLEKKKAALRKEERRLKQMKTMLQKLLFALEPGTFNEETERRYEDVMIKCGMDVEELQRAHM